MLYPTLVVIHKLLSFKMSDMFNFMLYIFKKKMVLVRYKGRSRNSLLTYLYNAVLFVKSCLFSSIPYVLYIYIYIYIYKNEISNLATNWNMLYIYIYIYYIPNYLFLRSILPCVKTVHHILECMHADCIVDTIRRAWAHFPGQQVGKVL